MKEKILILVKTYPAYSKKYFELVCTAGINEKGEWRRIYPIPFRQLDDLEQYKKYQWVEIDLEKNTTDSRPESYKPKNGLEIKTLSSTLPTRNNWQLRKEALKNTPVYTCLKEIIKKANTLSLCQFRPKEILGLQIESTEREWSPEILCQIKNEKAQQYLFNDMQKQIKVVKKLPYKFSYRFKDEDEKESKLMIEDWEIGQLYWNCLRNANRNEDIACEKVQERYENFIKKNDITLFLGTTHYYHYKSRNPFLIIGVFYPPKMNQLELF